jgi:hypothetical protein
VSTESPTQQLERFCDRTRKVVDNYLTGQSEETTRVLGVFFTKLKLEFRPHLLTYGDNHKGLSLYIENNSDILDFILSCSGEVWMFEATYNNSLNELAKQVSYAYSLPSVKGSSLNMGIRDSIPELKSSIATLDYNSWLLFVILLYVSGCVSTYSITNGGDN